MTPVPPRRRPFGALVAAVGALAMVLTLAPASSARESIRASAGATAADSPWSFSGSGFGHGVGMSQYGALAQAKAGRSARQILAFYYTGTTYDPVPDTQTIRVNIVRGKSSTTISGHARSAGGGTLHVSVGSSTMRAGPGRAVSLRRSGSTVVATCSTCSPTSLSATSVTVSWDEKRTDLSLGGNLYSHAPFVISPTPAAATLEGVLRLRLATEYLDQIREVPWSWPAAAQEAQAAAARGYALRKVSAGVRSHCACHVTDGQGDQVYGPVPQGSEATYWSRWKSAVAVGGSSTTGYVPRYQGTIIEALYSSSSSGHTVNNEDIWPGQPVAYLRGVDDPWSTTADNPRRTWTSTVTGSRVATAFGLPDVASLDLSDRTSAGTVRQARATSASGSVRTLAGDDMRRALGLFSAALHRPSSRVDAASPAGLAAASARSAPDSASTVVIASAAEADVAHLVMARPLAGSLDAPLLLSGRTRLANATRAELDRRGSRITRAYVVAGGPMVHTEVLHELRDRGIRVTRVGMSNQDATAAAVVDLMDAHHSLVKAGVSTQASVNEAAAFSAVAGRRHEPIVWAGRDAVGWRAKAALKRAGVRTVRLLGSTSKIPAVVATDLSSDGFSSMRFAGTSSASVSADIAHYFRNSYSGTHVVLARTSSGRTVDIAIAAAYGEPVLVVGGSPQSSVLDLVRSSPRWPEVRAFGPTSRVTAATLTRVKDC